MISFFEDNIVLILLILGAVVPFILSVYEKIAEKKKIRVMLILFSVGFVITLCLVIISDMQQKNSAQISAELEAKKTEMITTIRKNVKEDLELARQSVTLLENLQSKLSETAINEVAVELTTNNYDNLHVFEKSIPSKIPEFVRWLDKTIRNHQKEPALSLTLNAGRHYVVGLILGYLLANKQNENLIMAELRGGPSAWEKFPDQKNLGRFGEIRTNLRYVLFYNSRKNRLLGFADAAVFTRELLLYHFQGRASDIEKILNEPGKASVKTMRTYFTSFTPAVFEAANAYEAVKQMIEMKVGYGVALYQEKPWHISLANIIKLAS